MNYSYLRPSVNSVVHCPNPDVMEKTCLFAKAGGKGELNDAKNQCCVKLTPLGVVYTIVCLDCRLSLLMIIICSVIGVPCLGELHSHDATGLKTQ